MFSASIKGYYNKGYSDDNDIEIEKSNSPSNVRERLVYAKDGERSLITGILIGRRGMNGS